MSSPAGHCALQGGRRSTYTGRSVRQDPVLLACDEPGSRVIAKGFCIVMEPPADRLRPAPLARSAVSCGDFLFEQPEAPDVAIGIGLDAREQVGPTLGAEQMREAPLRPKV